MTCSALRKSAMAPRLTNPSKDSYDRSETGSLTARLWPLFPVLLQSRFSTSQPGNASDAICPVAVLHQLILRGEGCRVDHLNSRNLPSPSHPIPCTLRPRPQPQGDHRCFRDIPS